MKAVELKFFPSCIIFKIRNLWTERFIIQHRTL